MKMRSFCKPLIPLNGAKLRIISHAHKYFRLILYKKEDYPSFYRPMPQDGARAPSCNAADRLPLHALAHTAARPGTTHFPRGYLSGSNMPPFAV